MASTDTAPANSVTSGSDVEVESRTVTRPPAVTSGRFVAWLPPAVRSSISGCQSWPPGTPVLRPLGVSPPCRIPAVHLVLLGPVQPDTRVQPVLHGLGELPARREPGRQHSRSAARAARQSHQLPVGPGGRIQHPHPPCVSSPPPFRLTWSSTGGLSGARRPLWEACCSGSRRTWWARATVMSTCCSWRSFRCSYCCSTRSWSADA